MKSLFLRLFLITGLSCVANASPGKILIVLPGVNKLSTREGFKHSTGYFLSEFVIPAMMLAKMGFTIEIATPEGATPTIDKISDDLKWFADQNEYKQAKEFIISIDDLKHPRKLSEVKLALDQYAAIFIPGGHAAMEDLPYNNDLGQILSYFHKNHKPTALICHGPAALLSAKNKQGDWLYKNYQLTVFSRAEEKIEEQTGALDGHVLFYVEDALRQLGGNVIAAKPWTSHVVVDRELVTAQNPQSDKALASALIQILLKDKHVLESFQKLQDLQTKKLIGSYTTIFIGVKKQGFPANNFIERLKKHIALCVREFSPFHLQGYVAYAAENVEIAYQTWPNKEALDRAINSVGPVLAADAGQFMDSVIFEKIL